MASNVLTGAMPPSESDTDDSSGYSIYPINSFGSLPLDALHLIRDLLDDKSLARLAQIDRYFRDVCAEALLQRALEDKPPKVVMIPALLWAIDFEHHNLMKRILSQPGFDPRADNTLYALHYAAATNNSTAIDILFEAGFDVNTVTNTNEGAYTAVHAGAVNANPDAVECLIHYGADLSIKDIHGKTALQRAVCSPRYLLDKRETVPPVLFDSPSSQQIEIRKSIENMVVKVLRLLLDHGVHDAIDVVDDRGDTLLHRAVYDCIGLDFGKDVTVGSGVIRLLIEEDADIWATNNDGYTAFDQAIYGAWSSRTALNAFLDLGLDVNYKDASGDSLLYNSLRCTEESYPLVELLLTRGASTGDIYFHEFFNHIEDPDPVIFFKFVRILLQFGLRFDGDESECFTFATHIGDLGVMDIVYDFGADINFAARKEGMTVEQTPIQIAIEKKRVDILEYLLERDVKMTAEEKIKVGELVRREV